MLFVFKSFRPRLTFSYHNSVPLVSQKRGIHPLRHFQNYQPYKDFAEPEEDLRIINITFMLNRISVMDVCTPIT